MNDEKFNPHLGAAVAVQKHNSFGKSLLFVIIMAVAFFQTSYGVVDYGFSTLTDDSAGAFGGQNESIEMEFEEWTGEGSVASIANGVLTVIPVQNVGSAIFAVESSSLGGAGEYEMKFDVTRWVTADPETGTDNETASGFASVWRGEGYDLSNSTPDALDITTETSPIVDASGNATAERLDRLTFDKTGNNKTISFTYDGSSGSALIFVLGAEAVGFPNPEIDFENFRVQVIPEPSTLVWLIPILVFALCTRRRERHSS